MRLIGIDDTVHIVKVEIVPLTVRGDVGVDLLPRSAGAARVRAVAAGEQSHRYLIIGLRGELSLQFNHRSDGRAKPVARLHFLEVFDEAREHCPVRLGAHLKRVRSVDVVVAVARLYLVEHHIKITIF